MAEGRILIVGGDDVTVGGARGVLEKHGYAVGQAETAAGARTELERGAWDLALVGLALPDADGSWLVRDLAGRHPGIGIVVITQPGGRAQGFAARQAGASDFLEPPHDLSAERLLTVVANALERRRLAIRLAEAAPAERPPGRPGPPAGPPTSLNLAERERQAILLALEATNWNKQAAAGLLGLHRPTLYSKMRKHGIPQKRPT